jgi:protein SCO1/2
VTTIERKPASPRRSLVIAIWVIGLAIAGGLGWAISDLMEPGGGMLVAGLRNATAPAIGGPFALIDDTGKPRTDTDFRGKLMLIYFGYTHCPDACPTTLQDMADALAKVGPTADQIAPIFITIDPARDTVSYLKGYAEQFDPRFVALTGSDAQVAAAAKGYRVYYRKAGDQPNYLMDHSSIVYLMGRDGKFLTHFTPDTTPDQMAAALRKYLG